MYEDIQESLDNILIRIQTIEKKMIHCNDPLIFCDDNKYNHLTNDGSNVRTIVTLNR